MMIMTKTITVSRAGQMDDMIMTKQYESQCQMEHINQMYFFRAHLTSTSQVNSFQSFFIFDWFVLELQAHVQAL